MKQTTPRRAPRTAALSLAAALAAGALVLPAVAAAEDPRLVNVNGRGEVRVEPDQAKVTLGVEAREPTLEAARNKVNRGIEGVLRLARELGIAERFVNSTRINVQPEYEWVEKTRTRRLVAYVVNRSVHVDLRDLDKLGQLLERGMTLGANQVGDPVLDHSQRVQLEREALALATKDAQANAATMAAALGIGLGPVRTLNAMQDSPQPMPVYAMAARVKMADAVEEAPQSYSAGELVFRAGVSASFDLVPAAAAAVPPPAAAPKKK